MQSAIENGAPLADYVVWSLTDISKWAKGYAKRFGIVYIDFETQKPTIKASGRWFGDVVCSKGPTE